MAETALDRQIKTVHDPNVLQYLKQLDATFEALRDNKYAHFTAVRRLFSLDNSDTLNVEEVSSSLDNQEVPTVLRHEFTKAAYPLVENVSVDQREEFNERRWQLTQYATRVLGRGVSLNVPTITLAEPMVVDLIKSLKAGELKDFVFEINAGPGKGLSTPIVDNSALSDGPSSANGASSNGQPTLELTVDSSWSPQPDADSEFTIETKSNTIIAGKGLSATGNEITLTGWEFLNGGTITFPSLGSNGLRGTIVSYAPSTAATDVGTLTLAGSLIPDATSEFQIERAGNVIESGTGLTFSTDTFSVDNWTDPSETHNVQKGDTLRIVTGAAAGLEGVVEAFTASSAAGTPATIQMASGFQATPDSSADFQITTPFGDTYTGTGATVSAATVTLANWTGTNESPGLSGAIFTISGGPGAGLSGTIRSYALPAQADQDAGKLTMESDWQPAPDANSQYRILGPLETRYFLQKQGNRHTGTRIDIFTEDDDPALLIQYRIAQIDRIISRQLSAIMHHPDFQKLEASWRGLHGLVFNTETGTRLKLRLLNATRKELSDDLERAVEFDQSVLFKKIYEEEYGLFGGSPYSALLADYAFKKNPKEIAMLQSLSNVAAAAHAPLLTAAHPDLFGLDSFQDLDKPRDLAKIFESALHIKWRAFRESEDSRYVALTLPRVMLRMPYGPDNPVDGFDFLEQADSHEDYLWGNAAWALALRITTAFSLYSWTAAIRGYEGGGLVTGLPIYTYRLDNGETAVKVPTEAAITDRREKELNDLGFIALIYRKGTDQAAFFGGQTANKPKIYIEDDATANARLSALLPYMMAASRFAHYIKVIMRDKIGSFMTEDNVSTFLNRWITQYVLLNDEAGQETKARYPLREARIDVFADPARPGSYKAIVFLRPHFQLEELTVSIRLVTELPPPATG